MSNYTQTTFFTPKDSLPITDPNKTIFGAAYDVEFANISAAMATKLDSVFTNPALISLNITGAATPPNGFSLPSANTLGIYANTTQIATITSGGTVFGGATGGAKGAGTINATGLFVNGAAVTGGGGGLQVFTAATSASTISIGNVFEIYRTASASITSNATPTADTVLQFTSLPAGTYYIEAMGVWQCAVSGTTPGIAVTLGYTGTFTAATSYLASGYSSETLIGGSNLVQQNRANVNGVGSNVVSYGPTNANNNWILQAQWMLVATGSGTVSLQWSQSISSVNATTIQPNSWFRVTRLA